jgi:hypothetical protein
MGTFWKKFPRTPSKTLSAVFGRESERTLFLLKRVLSGV